MHRTPTYLFLAYSTSSTVLTGFSEWTSVSPLCMPSRKALRKASYWAFNSHAIDNEHSTLVPWTCNLFDCRQLLPLTSRLVASMSGLANNYSITTLYVLYATTLWKDPHSSYTSTSRIVPSGFCERTSVHHHSVCLLAQHYDEFILNSKSQPVYLGFYEWTSFHITTLYTRFASVLWRTRLPSTR